MTPRQVGQLILLAALWGGVFLLIKYALADFSPLEVAFFQAAIGALGLFAIVSIEGGRHVLSSKIFCIGPDRHSCLER